jgi:parvulin-like peptidyl-prolyl isomerase
MVKPFNDFVFNSSIGSIGLVETLFGFHIIKVTDKQDGIRLATVAWEEARSYCIKRLRKRLNLK